MNSLATDEPEGSYQDNPTEEASEKPLGAMLESINIAEKLTEDELTKIGSDASKGFELDLSTCSEWTKNIDEWTKLAKQTIEPKTWPWPRASNVKYPLLSTAAMQFAARAYPSLIPSDGKVVKAKAVGKDHTGGKTELALAVSTYMSYQLLEEMDDWEEQMDKLLIMLPIVGTMFKKTYWDSLKEKNCSHLVMPKNLVVNYWTKNLKDSERISEIIEMSPRKVKERQQSNLWLDVELGDAPSPMAGEKNQPALDETTPYTFIEQHTFLDLDEDGYKEPYIVTFHKESKKVVRIAARFDEKTITLGPDGKIRKIDPVEFYTKYGFIPNPDGGFYDIGFGVLLGPINESVNTLINQLVDSGSLNNLQSGFLGKGLRLRMGESAFKPGEWKVVNSTGDDLKKQIVPMPSKEPSNVLFQLMGSLITSGKELASVAEIFVGKMPGQNTPATTTMATIEQGMKVFTAVYKRIYRSMASEFNKLARLNTLYLNPNTTTEIMEQPLNPEDFDITTHKIYPGADPTAVSQTEKLLKAQGLMELLQTGILNPVEVVKRVLEAQEQPNWEQVLNPQVAQTGQMPPPPPDPKLMESQAKIEAMQQASQIKAQEASFKQQLSERDSQFQLMMSKAAADQEGRHKEMLAAIDIAIKTHTAKQQVAADNATFMQGLAHKQVDHTQKVQHAEQMATVQRKTAQQKGPTKK
jgi:chaperonin GroES